jgi:hypothetical protein
MRNNPALAVFLLILAAVCMVIGVLYAVGALQLFTSEGSGPHLKHLVLFLVLAVVLAVAANFARQRAA